MEATSPFEIDDLRRDWIDGISGEEFHRKVVNAQAAFADTGAPVVIQEQAPVFFAVTFFAAVSLGLPVALANPNWGTREKGQFDDLVKSGGKIRGSILIPTGGTTGGVKLAIHNWASLRASALAAQDFLGGGAVDSCCVLPLHHVSGLMQLIRAFVTGGSICFEANRVEGRCLSLVPTQLHRMMQSAECIDKLNTSRVVFVGGSGMPSPVEQQARELRLPVVPVYGMTETAAMVAAIPNKDFLASSGAGANALGDTKFSIDKDGAIRIRSSSLFKGYHGVQSLDLTEGYRTGDAGWLDDAGRLHLQGRMDYLINTGGEKVDPREVQEVLLQFPEISQAKVVGEPDEQWGEMVVAYVALNTGASEFDESRILSALKSRLSPFKVPKRIRLFDGLRCTEDSPQ